MYICNIYTNRGEGLYQIYKPEAKLSVYASDINRTPRFVYCFYKVNHSAHSLSSKFWTLVLFKLQKSNKKFGASLYQIYRTDTGHDFSLYFAYELLMILEIYKYILFTHFNRSRFLLELRTISGVASPTIKSRYGQISNCYHYSIL